MLTGKEELQHYAPDSLFRRRTAPVPAQKTRRHVAAIEAVVGYGGRHHCFPQAEGAFVPYQLFPSGFLLHARRIAAFDERGLWSFDSVWFSRHGTLVATAEDFVTQSRAGYFASELEDVLQVAVKEPLLQLVAQGRIARQSVSGLYLYCAGDPPTRQQQLRARQALPDETAAASAGIPPGNVSDELRAAIILFASLLDEQQRRLYAGLESLQLGSDRQIAELLGLDPHTVAKGRRQLLAQDVEADRVRAAGGGRKPVEKKRLR